MSQSSARALSDTLREVNERLATRELSADALERAQGHAAALLAELDAPPAARWYDAPLEPAPRETPDSSFSRQSPVRGTDNPIAPPLSLESGEREDGTPIVIGHARLGHAYEGPPRGVHGGVVAALFDDLLGSAQALAGGGAVTARLAVKYRHLTPIHEDLRFEAWVQSRSGRRITLRARCLAHGRVTAEAEALFAAVDFEEIKARVGAG